MDCNQDVCMGDRVYYCHETSECEALQTSPGFVTKVHEGGLCDLTIFLSEISGFTFKHKVPYGSSTEKGTWYWQNGELN